MDNVFYKTREEIEGWLNSYEVKNYTLIADEKYGFMVDVDGNVDIFEENLEWVPVKFNIITGYFDCGLNVLTSLEFCPNIIKYSFSCRKNLLTSLEFHPEVVGGSFDCSDNQLVSLEYCSKSVGGKFYCNNNEKLGYLQDITDFGEIYQSHIDFLKMVEFEKMNSIIDNNNNNEKIKKNKI